MAATINEREVPKFTDYRSRLMLGDLPSDFLRLQLLESQIYDPSLLPQEHEDFLGYFTLTIVEARLVKNSGPLGLLRMDPYVRFHLGHITHETPTAAGGGKNPQWKVSYRIDLFKGMDLIHLEVFDQRNFTEDSFIGQCNIEISEDVLRGQNVQHWYPLLGREANINENQGDILLIMSLMTTLTDPPVASLRDSASNSSSSSSNSISEVVPAYSAEDIRTIEEMFPSVDRQLIVNLLDKHAGNKDLAVNELLQSNSFLS